MRTLEARASALTVVIVTSLAACAFAACSLVTTWNDLPLGPIDAAVDARAEADGQGDGASSNDAAGACEAGSYACGGDRVVGDPTTLYRCLPDGGAAIAVQCDHGCEHSVKGDDVCVCFVGSPYCGNDQIVGDPNVLYKCQSDHSGAPLMACDAGCVVNKRANDACR